VVLADKALRKMRPKIPALTEALAGRFASHHAVLVRAILAHIDFLDANIAALDEEVAARLGPFRPAVELLKTVPGVGQAAAEVFVAETGGDMSRFPTAQHLAAWAGLAPANAEPAGKHRRAGSRKGASWLRRSLHRSGEIGLAQPRHLFVCPAPQHCRPTRPQQSHHGCGSLHCRGCVAHVEHWGTLRRPGGRLAKPTPRP
jgi:transposase